MHLANGALAFRAFCRKFHRRPSLQRDVNSPAVSVLVPTYNYARFIGEALESVLAQDFRDFELLVFDDCSSDNTAEIVKPFSRRDSRVRFTVNTANLGMVNNWNHCLEQARGHYIKFLFGDDKLCDQRTLGEMVALMERYPSATLAASARTILDEDSRAVEVWRTLKNGCHIGPKIIAACLAENKNLIGEPSAVLFRKEDARRGFDAKLRQIVDLEMWFHLLENGNLAYTREPLCGFRVHRQQQTTVNHTAGLALKEHSDFIANYTLSRPLPRKIFFTQLVGLRRLIRKHPDAVTPEMFVHEKNLSARISKGWYVWYWAGYKATKPFRNLGNSARKRVRAVLRR